MADQTTNQQTNAQGTWQSSFAREYNSMNFWNKAILWIAGLVGSAYVLFCFAPNHLGYRAPKQAEVRAQATVVRPANARKTSLYSIVNNSICLPTMTLLECEDVQTAESIAQRVEAVAEKMPRTSTNYDIARRFEAEYADIINDSRVTRKEVGLQQRLATEAKPSEPQRGKCTIHKTRGG